MIQMTKKKLLKICCVRETLNLSTFADSNTNTTKNTPTKYNMYHMYHVSCVISHVSRVPCHLSPIVWVSRGFPRRPASLDFSKGTRLREILQGLYFESDWSVWSLEHALAPPGIGRRLKLLQARVRQGRGRGRKHSRASYYRGWRGRVESWRGRGLETLQLLTEGDPLN